MYGTEEYINKKTNEWLSKIAPYNRHKLELNMDKAALLAVDMQMFFLNPESPAYTPGGIGIIPNIQRLIEAFRAAGRPVIYTKHVHHPSLNDAGIMGWWWRGMCIEGSPESEIHPDIYPRPKEKVIAKHRYSAFYNTDLETVLRVLKIEDLVISGVMTNMCCETTARDAYQRDYRVFLPADATGAMTEEMHLASLLNLAYGFAYVNSTEKILEGVGEIAE